MWNRKVLLFLVLSLVFLGSCGPRVKWQNLPQYVNTDEEIKKEIEYKMKKFRNSLNRKTLPGCC